MNVYRASVRYFAKMITALISLGVGYMLATCLVENK